MKEGGERIFRSSFVKGVMYLVGLCLTVVKLLYNFDYIYSRTVGDLLIW